MVIPGLRKSKILCSHSKANGIISNAGRLVCWPGSFKDMSYECSIAFVVERLISNPIYTYYTIINVSNLPNEPSFRFLTNFMMHGGGRVIKLIRGSCYPHTTPDIRDQIRVLEGQPAPHGSLASDWAQHMNQNHGLSLPV